MNAIEIRYKDLRSKLANTYSEQVVAQTVFGGGGGEGVGGGVHVRVLQEIGMDVLNEEACGIFARAGAKVTGERVRVGGDIGLVKSTQANWNPASRS